MHADDLARRGLKSGDLARVKSRRGELLVPVEASDDMRIGQAFMPMHWGSRYMSGLGVNALTMDQRDPVSKQPELKHAAIQVEKAPCLADGGDAPRSRGGAHVAYPAAIVALRLRQLRIIRPAKSGAGFAHRQRHSVIRRIDG
jgi:assimilatory nitrate reductase (NADH) alpha subunit apoprotein (EC 1.7.1.1)